MFYRVLLTFLVAIALATANTEVPTSQAPTTTAFVTTTALITTEPTTPSEPITTESPTTVEPITTTTPAPDGVPKFVFKDGNVSCVILQANLLIYISYYDGQGKVTKALSIPGSADTVGDCKEDDEAVTLRWKPRPLGAPFNFTLNLIRLPSVPSTASGFFVRNITFQYELSNDVFPGTNETGVRYVSYDGNKFETPGAMGYTCTPQQNVSIGDSVIVGVSSIHLEAFRNSTSDEFEQRALDCVDIPESDKVIPIVVGISAAILIVVAILAFFVMNRRRIQGYQAL